MFAFDKVFGMFTKLSLINEGQAKLKKHCRIVAQEDLRPGPSFRSSKSELFTFPGGVP